MLKQPSIPTRKNNNETNQHSHHNSGQRVTIPSLDNKTGTLRYVGPVNNKPGIWAGIELDAQGQGKNDGTVQGKQYFSCPPNTGIFIAVNKIIIHPPPSPTPITMSRLPISPTPKSNSKASTPSPKTSSTPRPSSIIKPKSSRTFTPKTSSTPKASTPTTPSTPKPVTPKTSATPKQATPRNSFTPKSTPRNSFTPKTTSKLSSTPKSIKRHSLNSLTQSRRSHTLRTSSIPIDAPLPPLQIDSSSDTTTSSTQSDTFHEATHQLYDMLEKTQRERDHLQHQIKTKEAAWERLVSSKESLSLQVQENESHKQRLSRDLEFAQSQVEQLQLSLAERDASIAEKKRDQIQQTQDQKRMERLELLVRELQGQLKSAYEERVQEQRVHAGELEQVRRQVAVSEETSACLEKECDELRRAGLEAIQAYEMSVVHMKQQHELMMDDKTRHVQQLEMTIKDLVQKQNSLFDDDEYPDQRHRLEEQLELAMTELDRERDTIHALTLEVEQLRLELTQSRQQNLMLEKRIEKVQVEFDREVVDKKRLIEEADAAFELQAKAEDELYQMKLANNQEYRQLLVAHQQLQHEFELMLEDSDAALHEKIGRLEQENQVQRQNYLSEKNKVYGLSQDLAILESLVENRGVDLETQLQEERAKVEYLQQAIRNGTIYCEYCDSNEHVAENCPNQNEMF